MKKFLQKIGDALCRFMYGRNGMDQLGIACLTVELVVYFLGRSVQGLGGTVLSLLSFILCAVMIFRMFSKNLARRRQENAWFLGWWTPLTRSFGAASQRRKDKEHKYFRCRCGAWCRVPRGKGKIIVTCPKCGAKMEQKS